MRTIHKKAVRALGPAFVAGTGVLAAAVALNVVVQLVHNTPHVGDILAFVASSTPLTDDGTRLIVHRQGQFGCVLDLNVLRRTGGSFIIETQLAATPTSFKAHWAGPRTSADAADCGRQADLIVDRLDLDILSLSAGGYGAHPKRQPMYTHYASN